MVAAGECCEGVGQIVMQKLEIVPWHDICF